MKHARADYDRIQDPAGLIPVDEPVFLLRGQDMCAPHVVRVWSREALARGASNEIVNAALAQAKEMERWQEVGDQRKVPDLPKFDTMVFSSQMTLVYDIQRALGMPKGQCDGVLGPVTMAAFNDMIADLKSMQTAWEELNSADIPGEDN